HARRVAWVERVELKARGDVRLGQRFDTLNNLLRSLNNKHNKLINTKQSNHLQIELLIHQLQLVQYTPNAKIEPQLINQQLNPQTIQLLHTNQLTTLTTKRTKQTVERTKP